MSARALFLFAFAAFSAAMLGFAAGAVWMVAALYMRHPIPWLALPAGLALGWMLSRWVRSPSPTTALLGALATLLAAVYVNALIAALEIAASMGMGLVETLRTAGPAMLLQLARMALTPADAAWYAVGALLAAIIAWSPLQRRSSSTG